MALTPDDIVNYEFKQAMRGYAIPQVDDLLDRLADQVERYEREIDDLRQRLRDTEARLGSTLETESTLKRTLVTAQQAAERALEDARTQADELRAAAEREVTEQLDAARSEAEEITKRARQEADEVTARAQEAARAELHDAREERAALESRLEELREMEHRNRSILRRHLESHLAVLDDFDQPPSRSTERETHTPAVPGPPSLQVRVRQEEGAGEPSFGVPAPPSGHVHSFPDHPIQDPVHDREPEPASSEAPGDGHITAGDGHVVAEDDHGADDEPAAVPESSGSGLFDHDSIDITEEVAVPSPWEPAPDTAPEEQPTSAHDEPPGFTPSSPWGSEASMPPPDPSQRDEHAAGPEHAGDGEHHHPYDDAQEPDPYEHYDRFRDHHDER